MKDLGPARSCLGIRISQENFTIKLDQSPYILEVLRRFRMCESKPGGTPISTCEKLCKNDDPEKSLVGKAENTEHFFDSD
jgi:hypothetical protein